MCARLHIDLEVAHSRWRRSFVVQSSFSVFGSNARAPRAHWSRVVGEAERASFDRIT
jgi:hypothetical protein